MKKIAFFALLMLPLLAGAQDEKQLKKLAKQGDATAAIQLGRLYEQREEYKKAAKYYEQAATPQADYELAALYLNGDLGKGTDDDLARGLALMRRSAQAGNRDGRYWLAHCYDRNIGVEGKEDSAFVLYSQLAAEGDSMAMLQTAIALDLGRGTAPDTARALTLYRQAGDRGVSNGYAFLAEFYSNGQYVPQNYDSAFALLQRAYALGGNNTIAAAALAAAYLNGYGTAPDTAAALPYLYHAAQGGHPWAMGLLGDYYNYGYAGIQPNADTALMHYHAASRLDDPHGDYMIGAWLYAKGEYDRALGFIDAAAGNGDFAAMLLYCRALLVGNGMEANPEAAYRMVRELAPAIESGEAYCLLGQLHYAGLGCPEDYRQAHLYFDTAANMGNTSAMMYLGDLYARGHGVPLDTAETLRQYERAVAAGSTDAMLRLAASYLQGRLAPHDPKRAAELYQRAADRGNLEGLCRLGLCYEQGNGVILNSRRAFNLYNEAAERGSAYGMYLAGMCYIDGVYVQPDAEQAFQWFLRAAEAGNLQSCYYVGLMYATGEGTKKNKKEAKRWLTLAADNGHPDAAERLQSL